MVQGGDNLELGEVVVGLTDDAKPGARRAQARVTASFSVSLGADVA